MVKFRKATSPAFDPGEIWVGAGGIQVEIIGVRKYPGALGDHCSDYEINYYTNPERTRTHQKCGWNFQVRYTHHSDLK